MRKLDHLLLRQETKKYYDSLAADYLRLRHPYGAARRREIILGLCKELRKGNALDGGAADGFVTAGLSYQGWSAIALDISTRLLKLARKHDVEVVAGDLGNIPFRNSSFRLVVCAEVFEHLADYSRATKELSRVVSSGGHVVISIPNPIWEPLFKIADSLRIKVPEKTKHTITRLQLRVTMERYGFESIKELGIIFWPFWRPEFMRKVSRLLEVRFPDACASIAMLFRKHRTMIWSRERINLA